MTKHWFLFNNCLKIIEYFRNCWKIIFYLILYLGLFYYYLFILSIWEFLEKTTVTTGMKYIQYNENMLNI